MHAEIVRVPAARASLLNRRPIFVASLAFTFVLLASLGAVVAQAVCVPTAFTVTSSAPPPVANWTTTSGVWNPAGNYPGECAGSSASDTNASPTTLIIDSAIPSAVSGLNFSCNGCVIDIQSGGSLTLDGVGAIGSGAQLKVSGGSLTIASGGSLTFASGSNLTFSSGFIDVQNGGAMSLGSPTTIGSGGQLQVGGTLTIDPAASLAVQSGATMIVNDGTVGGGGTINNSGHVSASSSGTATISTPLNNLAGATGVTVDGGTLDLSGGGNGDAPFVIASGATLRFPSNTYTMTPNGIVNGGGTLDVSGGTLSIGGVTDPNYVTLTAGTITGAGFLNAKLGMTWSGGTLTGTGGTQLAGGAIGNLDGATGTMTLDGRSFNDYGHIYDSATTNHLQLTNGAAFSVYGSFDIQQDTDIDAGSGGETFLVAPNGYLQKTGGSGTAKIAPKLTNVATVLSYSGNLEIANSATHSGGFFASTGAAITFSSGANFDSSSFIGGDGTIAFPSGYFDLAGAYDVTGTTIVSGGTLRVRAPATTNDLTFNMGRIDVVSDFTMTGTGTWSCGTIGAGGIILAGADSNAAAVSGPAGAFHVAGSATLTIDAASGSPTIEGALFLNYGTVKYTGIAASGNYFTLKNDALLENHGTFDIRTDAPILSTSTILVVSVTSSQPQRARRGHAMHITRNGIVVPATNVIDNQGTFEKTSGLGTTDVEPSFTTSDTMLATIGTLNFTTDYTQTAGVTTLGAGNMQTATTMQLQGGTLNGAGTITGSVQNDATVAPGTSTTTGTIAITSNYTQGAAGALKIKLASAAAFDQLTTGAAATLDGAFTASLLNGYQPANGTTWPVITFASRTGDFASKTLPTYPPHGSITDSYTPASYLLTAVVAPSSADLAMSVSGPATVNAAAPLSYSVHVTNGGVDPTGGTITVVDTLPAGVTSATASGTGWTCGPPSGGTITCTSTDTILSGQAFPTITVSMTAPPNGGSIQNSATVSSSFDGNNANNSGNASTTVIALANVSITKSGAAGVVAGQNITYTITVTNGGPSDAANVTVTDPPPANLTFVSNSGACTNPFPCSLGTLTANTSATITATYSTSPSFSGNVTNTATVSTTTNDTATNDDSASATTNVGAQANLNITKSGPSSANRGQSVTYTITVVNNGPSPAANTVVNDATPIGIAFLGNTGACTTPFPCSLGTIASGGSATIQSTYTVPANYSGASFTNTATVSSSVNDPVTTDNSSAVTTSVAQSTDLSIAKSGPSSVSPGQLINYTITVTNLGPSSAGAVTVSDNTPPGLTFVANAGACTSAFPCNVGTMNPSQTQTITSTYSVPANYGSSTIANTASVASSATDTNAANDSATATTNIVAQADLSIAKSGPASVAPGQNVTYTIVVANAGTLAAANTFVTDSTPAGLTFVANGGGCSTPFPCALGTIAAGQSVTISATYNVPSGYTGGAITNTANVSSSTADLNAANNSSTAITPLATATGIDIGVSKSGPQTATSGSIVTFLVRVFNNGPGAASNVVVTDQTPPGLSFVSNSGACTSAYPCTIASIPAQTTTIITSKYFVTAQSGSVRNAASVSSAVADTDPSNNFAIATVIIGEPCPANAPQKIAPASGATTASPVTFSWSAVPHATEYVVTINSATGSPTTLGPTSDLSASVALPNGAYTWTVTTVATSRCPAMPSSATPFTVCEVPSKAPVPSVVGETAGGQTYKLQWTAIDNTTAYEVQEATEPTFANAASTTIAGTATTFSKTPAVATRYFYRIRGIAACAQGTGPFSLPISIVVLPVVVSDGSGTNINVPAGSTTAVTFSLNVPGLPDGTHSFVATADKPWISVTPQSGIIGPDGLSLLISVDPTNLVNGTWTGTVIVVYGNAAVTSGSVHANASNKTSSFPISLSLVTPVSPVPLTQPATNAFVIPTVGHLPGFASNWRSDVRVANISSQTQQYQVTFNNGSGDGATPMKKTTIRVDAGSTIALDDVVRNWYGIGSLDDSSNGLLTIEQLDSNGVVAPGADISRTTVVASRTFSTSANGTVGQYIPAIPFADFIGKAGSSGTPSILSLQQLTQNASFRTNVGVVEASGKPVSLVMSVFDASGAKLLDLPLSLNGGEQRQLNSVMATNGITSLSNGRVEVKVTGGDGKATAYASVLDNKTNDPLLVSGTPLGGLGATRFIVPGIAELNVGFANWRSDLRIFNSGAAPQTASLTFYPLGNSSAAVTKTVTVNPGEVAALDNVLPSLFGVTNAGGALHVTTNVTAPLIVTARTYDDTANGTLGQFIPAVTAAQAVGVSDRALQILQAEESVRYRTNLGIVEVTGKPAVAEVSVNLPDSKVTPTVQIPLAAFESVQLPILSSFGIGAAYNARISVKVLQGDGKITAYGSVIDMKTQDPTYVPAQ
jgi:uncharacterized repeat protein (TIGR01451 family)